MMYKWEEVGPIMEKYRIEPYWVGDEVRAAVKIFREVETKGGFTVESEFFASSTGDIVMEAVMNCYYKIKK